MSRLPVVRQLTYVEITRYVPDLNPQTRPARHNPRAQWVAFWCGVAAVGGLAALTACAWVVLTTWPQ